MMFNLIELNADLKRLQKNVHKILSSDLIVYVFNLVEEENQFYRDLSQNETKKVQTDAYGSYLQPLLEVMDLNQRDQKIIVALNKIDHETVNCDEKVIEKAKQFVRLQFIKGMVDPSRIVFVPISALKK